MINDAEIYRKRFQVSLVTRFVQHDSTIFPEKQIYKNSSVGVYSAETNQISTFPILPIKSLKYLVKLV